MAMITRGMGPYTTTTTMGMGPITSAISALLGAVAEFGARFIPEPVKFAFTALAGHIKFRPEGSRHKFEAN